MIWWKEKNVWNNTKQKIPIRKLKYLTITIFFTVAERIEMNNILTTKKKQMNEA